MGLDLHTTSSEFLGHNAYGHPEFHPVQSPIGTPDMAKKLAKLIGIPVCEGCIEKLRGSKQLKDVYDHDERLELLEGHFRSSGVPSRASVRSCSMTCIVPGRRPAPSRRRFERPAPRRYSFLR
jgi:hypothetical protein